MIDITARLYMASHEAPPGIEELMKDAIREINNLRNHISNIENVVTPARNSFPGNYTEISHLTKAG